MAAAKYPETQVAVQAQLDAVVGKDRRKPLDFSSISTVLTSWAVPTFDDENLLPTVVAFYLEAYRWRPVSYGGEWSNSATSWMGC